MTTPSTSQSTVPRTTTNWWSIVSDEKKGAKQASQARKAAGYAASNTNWWSTWIIENPSEEAETSSIHASSFHSDEKSEKMESQVSRMRKASRKPNARPAAKSVGVKPKANSGDRSQSDLLELFQNGMCNYEQMKPQEMQVMEQKLEKRLKQMKNPALWNLINPESENFVGSGSFESGQSSEYTNSLQSESETTSTLQGGSVLSTWSEEDSGVFEDLEQEIPFLRSRIPEQIAKYSSSKYKELLNSVSTDHDAKNKNVTEKQDPLLGPEEFPDDEEATEDEPNPTKEEEIEIVVPEPATGTKGESKKETQSLGEPIVSSLTDESSHKYGDSFVVMASLPSESRTCMALPPIFKNRFGFRRALKLTKTESTASTMNTAGASLQTASASQDLSEHQAYVAFARRGRSPVESIRLFELDTAPDLPASSSEAVIRVDFSTVSPSDCSIRRGDWWGETSRTQLELPIIPGGAFVGVIDAVDASGTRGAIRKGDRVTSLVRVGANSRYMSSDTSRLVKVPPYVTNVDAVACLPEMYLSAFQAVHIEHKNGRYRRNSLAGKTVLILGGATALGRALIEVSVASGATCVYATGRDKEFDAIKAVGGMPLSKTPHHWLSILTDKIDVVVGAEEPYTRPEFQYDHVQTLNKNGKLVLITAPDQDDKSVIDLDVINERDTPTNRKLHHYNVFDSWESDTKQARRDLSHLIKLLDENLIRPNIIERVPLSKVAKAQDKMERKRVHGFTLCSPWMKDNQKKVPAGSSQSDESTTISHCHSSMDGSVITRLYIE